MQYLIILQEILTLNTKLYFKNCDNKHNRIELFYNFIFFIFKINKEIYIFNEFT